MLPLKLDQRQRSKVYIKVDAVVAKPPAIDDVFTA